MGEFNSNQSSEPKFQETIITEESSNKYAKIGGWLIIVAIGLLISAVLNFKNLIQIINLIASKTWPLVITLGSQYYQAGVKETIYFEIIGVIIILVLNLSCIYLLFRKKKLFTKLIISLLIFNIIFEISNRIIVISNTNLNFNINSSINAQLARPIIAALIWIPYFILSDRVKKTFIK